MPALSRLRLSLVLLAVLLLTSTTSLLAQDWKGVGRARGRVADQDGTPIADAQVSLMFKGEKGAGPVLKTDKRGEWAYIGLITGTFTIVVEAEGFVSSEGEIRIVEYETSSKPFDVVLRKDQVLADNKESERLLGILAAGNQKLQAKDYAGARAAFNEVLAEAKDPAQQAQLRAAIASTFLDEGKNAEARAAFQELLPTATPEQRTVLTQQIARTYYNEKNIDASVKTLDEALAANPQDIGSLRLIIDILVASGREQQAEPYMARLPAGEKVDANAMLNIGITAYNAGDNDAALEKFRKVADAYPDNADAFYYMGLSYLAKSNNEGALTAFETMLKLAPKHKNAEDARQFVDYLKTVVKR
jgi:tetratricopeptide (TPR) repeat protein